MPHKGVDDVYPSLQPRGQRIRSYSYTGSSADQADVTQNTGDIMRVGDQHQGRCRLRSLTIMLWGTIAAATDGSGLRRRICWSLAVPCS